LKIQNLESLAPKCVDLEAFGFWMVWCEFDWCTKWSCALNYWTPWNQDHRIWTI